ncbi:hypothetical protein QA047_gp28 [Salmonella phage vB_SenS_ER21]|uniref:HNH endonuclease n=1 Tax=Salmonella phage vB_SenS_ER21 TaxID=2801566 RepID=A0A7T8EKM4_9CAUD|nr:hypothetical protein QA047_gp28 [Salmonella phage vB_SenS_ER21]QQO88002.1 hypothetical protein OOCIFDHN_00053 [Salmonella phage vB_SenS_ER21]QQO88070.1 hypothetical protein LAJEKOGL_00061 [Salmonella phage vB_SenS_ER22]
MSKVSYGPETGIFTWVETKRRGFIDNFDEAVAARKAAEVKYGFHENHGKKRGV